MDKQRLIEKARKCLALAESSEPHEAARALAQANALLKKAGVSAEDVRYSVKGVDGYKRPPGWYTKIATVIASAFQCSAFGRRGEIMFAGIDPAPELAAYALDVVATAARQAQKKHKVETGDTSRQTGKAFMDGFADGVVAAVHSFASPVSNTESSRHHTAIKIYTGADEIRKPKARKDAFDGLSLEQMRTYLHGNRQGSEVEINAAVSAREEQAKIA